MGFVDLVTDRTPWIHKQFYYLLFICRKTFNDSKFNTKHHNLKNIRPESKLFTVTLDQYLVCNLYQISQTTNTYLRLSWDLYVNSGEVTLLPPLNGTLSQCLLGTMYLRSPSVTSNPFQTPDTLLTRRY